MTVARGAALAAIFAVALAFAAACSKEKTPKVDAAAERAAALERAKKDVFGTQVNALETAKGLEADVNKKAAEAAAKIDNDAK
jgi:hypothetical protein